MTGFSFNGTHCRQFGITAKTISRPVLPRAKEFKVSAARQDGEADFSADRWGKRYNPVVMEIALQFAAESLAEMQEKLSRAAVWLLPDGKLRFDDLPGVYWLARAHLGFSYSPLAEGRAAAAAAKFYCEPFSFGEEEVSVPLFIGTNNFSNPGTYYSAPVIEIQGGGAGVCVSMSGVSLGFGGAFSQLEIDCGAFTVKNGGADALGGSSGGFPKVAPGANALTLSVASGGVSSAVLRYTPRYIYGKVNGG
ncbi:MAG: phage tail family protein [Clostridiales bacterium]|jgi:phage-related protein|nr:phage tail family protein [Clostridiales bacterium]